MDTLITTVEALAPLDDDGDLRARVEALEGEVAELKARLDSLLHHLGRLKRGDKIAHWGGRLRQHCAESVAAGAGGGGKLDAAGGLVARVKRRRCGSAKPADAIR